MSKIAEQKALEEYPEEKHITYGMIPGGNPFEIDINTRERNGYVKGYDQAMQDFLEYLKYCSTFTDMNGNTRIDDDLHNILINDFKNYMEEEL